MKIILSRKGFDSASGGCPNPILPDGTLLSLPIPSENTLKYSDLRYGNLTYTEILAGLRKNHLYDNCHLDPDIRADIRITPIDGWKPAFGQTGSSLGLLRNAKISIGDLFLFFGLFHQTEYRENTSIGFVRGGKAIQIIYGYLQIGEILDTPESIAKYHWHPHADRDIYKSRNNALYLPSKKLSFCSSLAGFGVLPLRDDRVLTKKNKNAATWVEHDFLMPQNIMGTRKNSAKDGDGLYYAGQWQELVIKPNTQAENWAIGLISQ